MMSGVYRLREDFTTASIGEDTGLMDVESGKYFTMDPIASKIWGIIKSKPVTIEHIVSIMKLEYMDDGMFIQEDVEAYLNRLLELNLIIKE